MLDAADLLWLVDYMYNDGNDPPCFAEADVDDTGSPPEVPLNVADLLYLVDYMFSDGPVPLPCP